ncbi:DMT family transporter [Anaeromyxobacter sp. SG64]|uniref:DMT family transporter n=1 Tax=Anaeromyxobacter sp. SG64 TaxID=2925409 RepID=UPI0035A82D6B
MAPLSRRGWLLFVALCVIWGIPYLLIKVAVREITPASLVFLRTAIGALVLLPVVLLSRGDLRALLPRWRPIVLFTVAELAVPWLLLSDAERHLPSSLAGLLVASVPLVGVVLARLSGVPEPLGGRRLAGLWVGLAGVVALLGLDVRGGDLRAVGEMVLVVIGYAVGPMVVSRRLTDVRTLDVVAVSLVLGAVGYAPFGISQLPAALPSIEAILSVVVLGVLCTALAFVLFFRLIAEVGPVRATVVAYVNPAVAVAAGVAVLAEPLTAGTVIGFLLILAGSWLATGAPVRAAASSASPMAPGSAGQA